jgi:hypothetical protein
MARRHRDTKNAPGGVVDRSMTIEMAGSLVAKFSSEVGLLDYKRNGVLLGEQTDRKGWHRCVSGR